MITFSIFVEFYESLWMILFMVVYLVILGIQSYVKKYINKVHFYKEYIKKKEFKEWKILID